MRKQRSYWIVVASLIALQGCVPGRVAADLSAGYDRKVHELKHAKMLLLFERHSGPRLSPYGGYLNSYAPVFRSPEVKDRFYQLLRDLFLEPKAEFVGRVFFLDCTGRTFVGQDGDNIFELDDFTLVQVGED